MMNTRDYIFKENYVTSRLEYEVICEWIPKDSVVVDLACGDGSLLSKLQKKGIMGIGVEISESGVKSGMKKGVKMIKGRADQILNFKDKEFDYAVCNVSIQMVSYPEILFSEMMRVSKRQIISFPNFGFFLNRLEMIVKGRMPKTMLFGYQWYSTGHIHQLSVADFLDFCVKNNIKILKQKHLHYRKIPPFLYPILDLFPNFFSLTSIFMVEPS